MIITGMLIEENKSKTKLTVTATGNVRIKIAAGTSQERKNRLIHQLTKIAEEILTPGIELTIRGNANENSIRMRFGGTPRIRKKHKDKTKTYWFSDTKEI